ncbi:MAG: GTPase HflX [Candidatus Marinimicrobia bacterium]|jgi:GTP-binding protein HflX|nr:GTPase HflX [Candidatus Neomarinimicrobiota bacterium]|tara:strand:- start:65 stop:1330 length:1266 start_codon:yes stop_codon:yes gene_type:complete
MIEKKEITNEKALLIGVIKSGNTDEMIKEHLDELELLAQTAGAEVVGRITQRVSKINPATFIGKGKADQIIEQSKELDVKLIIFDDELSPGQIKNYHKISENIKVLDRSGLILDIFQKHARTKEATTQVDLAYLEYLLPRLTRQWTHLERQMGGIGTRAGMGETQIEVDRRLIRTRITRLKKDLEKIEKERATQSVRRESEFRVSLVGYTNAGKSTLFKALTGSDVYIQDQLFATLDTTIRKLDLDTSHTILLSDTVGFIRKLPHNLVASFKSTLKEVLEADLIVMVLDMSSPQIRDHVDTITDVLKEMNADSIPVVHVLNKVDLISDGNFIEKLQRSFPGSVTISAHQHLKLSDLTSKIVEKMESNYQTIDLQFSYEDGKAIAQVQQGVEVLERAYEEEGVKLKIRGSRSRISQIMASIN